MFIPKRNGEDGPVSTVVNVLVLLAIGVLVLGAAYVLFNSVDGNVFAPIVGGRRDGLPMLLLLAPLAIVGVASIVVVVWFIVVSIRSR